MTDLVAEKIGTLPINDSISDFTDGDWAIHHLVEHITNLIGPSNLFFSTFSFSDAAIRHLHYLKTEGKLLEIKAIIEEGNKKTKIAQLFFAAEIFDEIKLTRNHSKVYLFQNINTKVTVITSANLSKNRRKETYTIDTREKTFDKMMAGFWDIYNNSLDLILT